MVFRRRSGLSPSNSRNQLPMLNLPETARYDITAAIGEFVGTFMFLLWSFAGTQISNTPKPPPGSNPNPSALLYASLAFGFSLTVNVWAFYRITGGLFNPSVRFTELHASCGGNSLAFLTSGLYGRLPWRSFS